jgi:hypothetical protein
MKKESSEGSKERPKLKPVNIIKKMSKAKLLRVEELLFRQQQNSETLISQKPSQPKQNSFNQTFGVAGAKELKKEGTTSRG